MNAELVMNWVLSTGFDVSILIALILVFRRPFGRMFGAGAAYALWLLPFLRVLLPEFSITLPRPAWMNTPPTTTPEISEFFAALPATNSPISEPVNWQFPVLVLWLSVAVFWLVIQMMKQRNFMNDAMENSSSVSGALQEKLSKATEDLRMKKSPQIRISSTNTGPLVTGVVNPVILLPKNFETDFSDRQQFFALTHELAHIKRYDLMAAFSTLVFRALNWPNPLVHLSAARFRADQEAACDAYVLKAIGGGKPTTQSYMETLIHSARLSRGSLGTMEPTPSNPLCLSIHHPLKERLMTMKTSKTRTTLLSRVGVAAFLAAGLAITAPITIASAQDAPKVETKMKKVINMVENENGVETTKTLEIVEEDGVRTVYSIDEHGNKTVVTEEEFGEFPMMDGDLEIMVIGDGDGNEKQIKIIGGNMPHGLADGSNEWTDGEHGKIMIKRISKGNGGLFADQDSDVFVFSDKMGGTSQTAAMVTAAKNLLDQAESMQGEKELSSKAKRKLEKARKALAEAQEALEEE